ncbi:hypothetical protein [Hahella ganghwensis]|uniref:hypothetical protein n=1 Tax=Hahella ganghwensis TaxID=286420 RepID=UPI00039E25B3|nr:hypothetical protein [Hahella ganghwensis]
MEPKDKQLRDICRSLLDNADLLLQLDRFPEVLMTFFVYGTVEGEYRKVIIRCRQVVSFNLDCEGCIQSNDLHSIYETLI